MLIELYLLSIVGHFMHLFIQVKETLKIVKLIIDKPSANKLFAVMYHQNYYPINIPILFATSWLNTLSIS